MSANTSKNNENCCEKDGKESVKTNSLLDAACFELNVDGMGWNEEGIEDETERTSSYMSVPHTQSTLKMQKQRFRKLMQTHRFSIFRSSTVLVHSITAFRRAEELSIIDGGEGTKYLKARVGNNENKN
ncbi:hypothetical protein TWF730_001991 [Orbilia blumenaviensis]|uniref:Uncharacterized protein n=1 Tax=Orbilia blumenaviensis TaxID=1796055 RepID=A0AAV9UG50_9PEZI